jgi:hypothetical protein
VNACAKFAHALAALTLLAPPAEAKHPKPKPAKVLVKNPKKALAIEMESVDLETGHAIVLVSGVKRGPEARLFVFTDDRDHRFIALGSRCQPADDRIRCTLDLPKGYLAYKVVQMALTVGKREIVAPPGNVLSKFAAAGAPSPPPALLDTPRTPPDAGH